MAGYRALRTVLVGVLMVAGLVIGQATAAFADTLSNVDVPYPGPSDNPCIPEDVLITSGVFHMTFHFTTTSSGNLHLDSMDNTADVHGVGMVTGATYTITDIITNVLNLDPATDTYFKDDYHAISHGPAPNYVLRMGGHVVMNADGVVTVDTVTFETNCPPIT